MKKLLILLLFISITSSAQETEFTFNSERGMTDFIVTPVEGKTAPEIYKKIIEWIKVTYKNPDKVILSTIENEYVRFEGSSETLYALNIFGKKNYQNVKYEIEISIKDNKYKFDLVGFQIFSETIGWTQFDVFIVNTSKKGIEFFYKTDGSLRNAFKYLPEVPIYFNDLNKSLSESFSTTVKKSDW